MKPAKKTLTPREAEEAFRNGREHYYARDYGAATEYFIQAANAGHADAQYWLGACYRYGYGVSKDFQKAREWFGKAAAQGHGTARQALDSLNKNGR